MSEPASGAPSVGMQEVKVRSLLIFGTIGVFASIIFGLLYLFVLAPSAPGSSAGWFLFSFATGITMIVMPCTLPLAFVIVPLSMGKGVVKGLGIALAFGIGIAITQSLYGVIAALIGQFAIGALGAPLESVKNWVYLFAGTFAFLFALGEIGLLKVRMPTYSGAAPAFIQRRQDVFKALLLGLFLGNIGIGCPHPATPLLLIEAASSGNVIYGWLLFMTHAIGRVLPLLLLAFLGILGVNGLAWLMSRKESVERATGWAMVFVAGFILTLGLFTHDWWVNSGIHSSLEKVTQESYFNERFNDMLNSAVVHEHGLEVGTGMFGLPLWLGNWFLVSIWVVPMWWWWLRKRKAIYHSPAFRLREIESRMDRLEKSRRELEEVIKLDDVETDFNLAEHKTQMDALEKLRRDAEEKVQFAEKGTLKEPIARAYEARILSMQRNYLIVLTVFLSLTFIYFLPTNFYLASMSGGGHGMAPATTSQTPAGDGHTGHAHGTVSTAGTATGSGTLLNKSTAGLPDAKSFEFVRLQNGDSYDMTASYVKKQVGNRSLRMMAYNGSVPGPFIFAPQGSTVTINFTNNTDIDQTIHSHGVRIDNRFDGVPDATQKAVKPGETFAYTVTFPDAGVNWYHPHTRDDIGQELGLYGNYIIEPEDENYWGDVHRNIPLIVDDILIENGEIANFFKEYTDHALIGRFGNTYLVNGEENYALPVKKGEVIRFYVTNVSNVRTYNLSIPGAEMKIVGADQGRYEREFTSSSFLISPAERIVVEAYFKNAGNYRLVHSMPTGNVNLATFAVSDEEVAESKLDSFHNVRVNESVIAEFSKMREFAYKTADKRLKLTVDGTGLTAVDHGAHAHGASGASSMMGQSGMAGMQWDDRANSDAVNTTKNVRWMLVDEATGKANMDIPLNDWTWKVGSLVKISITNANMMVAHTMQHPIHLHGQRFVELSRNGVINQNMAWKDTTLVLPGETLDIVVEMTNPGEWMLHCHIVEHLHASMMMSFRVEGGDGKAPGDDFRATLQKTTSLVTGSSTYTFGSPVDAQGFSIQSDRTRFSRNTLQHAALSFKSPSGTALNLSSTAQNPLRVTFVKNDNSAFITTYPGKTDFVLSTSTGGHIDLPGAPPHTHSLRLINVAYADGDGSHDPAAMAASPRTYSVPVVFTANGTYRAFVEFIPEGESAYRTVTFDVTVSEGGFSVDSLGWSPNQKWWILLIVSLLLMLPLVWWVRKYINTKNI